MTSPVPSQSMGLSERRLRLVRAVCLLVPALVLAAAYLWMALDHGTLALRNVVVHESGRYTLSETILYFSHFLREVPVALAYGLFLLGLSGNAAPQWTAPPATRRRVAGAALAGVVGLVTVGLYAATRADGAGSALLDLFQYRTRDDLAGYGTHWRYHLLSTLWFGAAAAAVVPLSRRVLGTTAIRYRSGFMGLAWGYVLALTLVFGVSPDVVADGRYIGHQAREILTHGPVTLLAGLGLLLSLPRGPEPPGQPLPRRPWIGALSLAATLLIPAYLVGVGLAGNVVEQGQSSLGLGAMVGAHYFEHSLDYLLVLLVLVGGLALSPGRTESPCHE